MGYTQERERFEKWAEPRGYGLGKFMEDSSYSEFATRMVWSAWQASLASRSSEWIPVEQALPPVGADILFNVNWCYGVEKGRWNGKKWVSDRTSPYNDTLDFDRDAADVWMLLPVPTPPVPALPVKEEK